MKNDYLKPLPPPEKPAGFEAEMLAICGVCPNLTDPYLRYVWGPDALENWDGAAGGAQHRYPDPDDKYTGAPFWILEGWQSPDVYDRREWEANRNVLGEFPARGVWDYIETLRGPGGEYIPLGEAALQRAREWRFWKSKGHRRAVADLLENRRRRAALKEQRYARRAEAICDEHLKRFSDAENNPRHTEYSFAAPDGYRQTAGGIFVKHE